MTVLSKPVVTHTSYLKTINVISYSWEISEIFMYLKESSAFSKIESETPPGKAKLFNLGCQLGFNVYFLLEILQILAYLTIF